MKSRKYKHCKGTMFYRQVQKRRAKKLMRLRTKRNKKISEYRKKLSEPNSAEVNFCMRFPGYTHVKAPNVFSFIQNKTGVLEFINKLKQCRERKKKTLVRLDGVNELSTDAILILLSTMVRFQVDGVEFNGTRPEDRIVNQKLADSGFFAQLYLKSQRLKNQYSFKKVNGCLYTHGQTTVASELADQLVKSGSETVWGEPRRCPGIQKTLLELMHNTYDHAGQYKGDHHWWVSVEHDQLNKIVTFAFIDFGVGIFRSLENKGPNEPLYGALELIKQKFPGAQKQVDKLKLILEGRVQLTQSKSYFRGKGLAKIYNHYQSQKIASLCILSNYAFVDADKNEFSTLKDEFLGTFISFKITTNIHSLPWQI